MSRCISSSILMQKFDIIVEYGGPCGFSQVSTHFHKYIGSQTLHFLKVELDGVAKAMCEGVVVTSDNRGTVVSLTSNDFLNLVMSN